MPNYSEELRAYERAHYAAHKEAHRIQGIEYRSKHAKEIQKRHKTYREKNKEKISASSKKYYALNIENIRKKHRDYSSGRPEENCIRPRRRRARQHNAPRNDFTAAQWKDMKAHYDYKCVYCGRKMKQLTMDHLTPLSKGGEHTLSNIVPACRSCNSKKHTGPVLRPVQPLLL